MNNKVWLQSSGFIQVPPFPLYHEPFSKWKKVILKLSWKISLSGQLKFIVNLLPIFQGLCWWPKMSGFLLQGFWVFEYYPTTSQVKTLLNLLKSYPLILSSKSFLRKHSESFETWRFWTSAGTTLLLFLGVSIFF